MSASIQVVPTASPVEEAVEKVRAIVHCHGSEPAAYYVGIAQDPTRRLAAHGVDPRMGVFWYTDMGEPELAREAARAAGDAMALRVSRLAPASGANWLYVFKMTSTTKPSRSEALRRAEAQQCA